MENFKQEAIALLEIGGRTLEQMGPSGAVGPLRRRTGGG